MERIFRSHAKEAISIVSFLAILLVNCSGQPGLPGGQSPPIESYQTESFHSINLNPSTSTPFTEAGIDHEMAIESIRAFIGSGAADLTFQETTIMINSPNADLLVGVYMDGLGGLYSVDPDSYKVVDIDPSPIRTMQGEPLALEQLRKIAEERAAEEVPGFGEIRESLSYEEGSKLDTFFFRWEAVSRDWKYNPPIFQVGIRADGELLTYTNTFLVP